MLAGATYVRMERDCSQVLDVLGYEHVQYETVVFRDQLAGKEKMLLPLADCIETHGYNTAVEFCNFHQMLD